MTNKNELAELVSAVLEEGDFLGSFQVLPASGGEVPSGCIGGYPRSYHIVDIGSVSDVDDDGNGTEFFLRAGVEVEVNRTYILWLQVEEISTWGCGHASCGGREHTIYLATRNVCSKCVTKPLLEYLEQWLSEQR